MISMKMLLTNVKITIQNQMNSLVILIVYSINSLLYLKATKSLKRILNIVIKLEVEETCIIVIEFVKGTSSLFWVQLQGN